MDHGRVNCPVDEVLGHPSRRAMTSPGVSQETPCMVLVRVLLGS